MSGKGTSLHLRVNSGAVEVEIHSASASDVQVRHIKDDGEEGEWEIVEEEAGEHLELVVATGPVPLHLLRRSRLQPLQGWSPEERIRRAFEWGQKDTQAALEGISQLPQDAFPVRSCVYVILYDTTGDWPRVTRSLQKFYEAVKIPCRGKAPSRQTPWRSGVVSRGFPSQVEAEAYLLGGQCQYPRKEF